MADNNIIPPQQIVYEFVVKGEEDIKRIAAIHNQIESKKVTLGVDTTKAKKDITDVGKTIDDAAKKKLELKADVSKAAKEYKGISGIIDQVSDQANDKLKKALDKINSGIDASHNVSELREVETKLKDVEKATQSVGSKFKESLLRNFKESSGVLIGKKRGDTSETSPKFNEATANISASTKSIASGLSNIPVEKLVELDKVIAGVTDEFEVLNRQVDFLEANVGTLKLTPKELATLKNDFKNARTIVDTFSKELHESGVETEKVTTKNVRLVTQLRNMRNELAKMDLAGKGNTKVYKDMQREAAKLEDTIKDNSVSVRLLSSDTAGLDAGIGAVRGVVAAFTAYQGVLGLAGVKNEDFEKTLLKINGAMAVLQGLQEIGNLLQKESVTRLVAARIARAAYNFVINGTTKAKVQETVATVENTTATQVQTAATNAATASTGALAISMRVLRGALLATGIGALILALGVLIQYTSEYIDGLKSEYQRTQEAKKAAEELTQAYVERINTQAELQRLQKGGIEDQAAELELMKQKGAALDKVYTKEKILRDNERIAAVEKLSQLKSIADTDAQYRKVTAERRKKELEEEAKQNKAIQYLRFLFGGKPKDSGFTKFVKNPAHDKEVAELEKHVDKLNKIQEGADAQYQKDRLNADLDYRAKQAEVLSKSTNIYVREVTARVQAARVSYEKDVLNFQGTEDEKHKYGIIRETIYQKEKAEIQRQWAKARHLQDLEFQARESKVREDNLALEGNALAERLNQLKIEQEKELANFAGTQKEKQRLIAVQAEERYKKEAQINKQLLDDQLARLNEQLEGEKNRATITAGGIEDKERELELLKSQNAAIDEITDKEINLVKLKLQFVEIEIQRLLLHQKEKGITKESQEQLQAAYNKERALLFDLTNIKLVSDKQVAASALQLEVMMEQLAVTGAKRGKERIAAQKQLLELDAEARKKELKGTREQIEAMKKLIDKELEFAKGELDKKKAPQSLGELLFGNITDQENENAKYFDLFIKQTIDFLNAQAQAQIDADNRAIEAQEAKIARFKELAEFGTAEQLELEENRLSELQRKREEDVQKQRQIAAAIVAINNIITISETIKAVAKAFGEGNLLTGILTAAALAATIFSTISQVSTAFGSLPAFDKGHDRLPVGSMERGGQLAIVHPNEAILTENDNREMDFAPNKKKVELYKLGKLYLEGFPMPDFSNSMPGAGGMISDRETKDLLKEQLRSSKNLERQFARLKIEFNVDRKGIRAAVETEQKIENRRHAKRG